MAQTLNKSPLAIWTAAARPKTLGAAVAPVLVGTAMAWEAGGFHALAALCALLGALLIQIGTNFSNDYADFVKGADTPLWLSAWEEADDVAMMDVMRENDGKVLLVVKSLED